MRVEVPVVVRHYDTIMPYRYAVDTLQRITLHYYSTGTSITI